MTPTEPTRIAESVRGEPEVEGPLCGVCQRPAEVMATVPMCGERPRYPMCWECFEDINYCDYAEDGASLW